MAQIVKVFSTPTCLWCVKIKQYLDEKNVAYQNIDVSIDPYSAQKMFEKSGHMGVPQIWIDDEVIIGFDKKQIDQSLGL